MNRGVWASVLLLAGCQVMSSHHAPSPGVIPPPSNASGAWVAVEDHRPAWERRPERVPVRSAFGPVSLYPLWRTAPNLWVQLVQETEAVVAAMPEKPGRVNVVVESFRLAERDEAARPTTDSNTKARPATQAQDENPPPGAFDHHPSGASCSVRAVVWLTFPGGPEQSVKVDVIASGENGIPTKYEAIDFAAKLAVEQYGRQLRQGVGLPPGG